MANASPAAGEPLREVGALDAQGRVVAVVHNVLDGVGHTTTYEASSIICDAIVGPVDSTVPRNHAAPAGNPLRSIPRSQISDPTRASGVRH